MSSVHYKFRNALSYNIVGISGLTVKINQLKQVICEKESIRIDTFDLEVQNAHTHEEYKDDDFIPRNSSVVIKRVPRNGASKLPKLLESNVYGDGTKGLTGTTDAATLVNYEAMSESERITHMKHTSTVAYHSSNYQRKTFNQSGTPPPSSYVCNRCLQPGHWYKTCPMMNTKRTTGIPSEELMTSTKDDPHAMLHPSGKYVVPIMHWRARNQRIAESNTIPQVDLDKKAEERSKMNELPFELTCPLCNSIFKDAVLTMCCGSSFCADCLTKKIFDSKDVKCPGTGCQQKKMTSNSFCSNKKLREKVGHYTLSLTCLSDQTVDNKIVDTKYNDIVSSVNGILKSTPPAIVSIDLTTPLSLAINSKITAETLLDNISGQENPLAQDDSESSLELCCEPHQKQLSPVNISNDVGSFSNLTKTIKPNHVNIAHSFGAQMMPYSMNNQFACSDTGFPLFPPGFSMPPINNELARGRWDSFEDETVSKKENKNKRSSPQRVEDPDKKRRRRHDEEPSKKYDKEKKHHKSSRHHEKKHRLKNSENHDSKKQH
uniref:E3 ubiquitin-protein ligase RBBP6 n=1 Tax=Rhabditophanes sp. KR3021 TaxID=114890 RepID=A0AC35TPY5_9BILA